MHSWDFQVAQIIEFNDNHVNLKYLVFLLEFEKVMKVGLL